MKRRSTPQQKTSIVAVVWHDAHDDGASAWIDCSDIDPDPYRVVSVGVLLPSSAKPDHVSVARSVAENYLDHILHIPSAMVQEITVLGLLEDLNDQG